MKIKRNVSDKMNDEYLEITKECDNCSCEISKEEYRKNNGKCNGCIDSISNEFSYDNNGCF